MPITEHPFYGSWGYQTTGYFAPTSRYGTPQDFMFLVDTLHQAGIGVILDWVPSHFRPTRMAWRFDGTAPVRARRPAPGLPPGLELIIFNYGRNEVRASCCRARCSGSTKFHIDGLRVDAVASMLYLDYSRKEGEWIPNRAAAREPRGDLVPAPAQRGRLRDHPGVQNHRRGVHRVADGLAPDLPRRPGLRHEVEHGLDARHAELHAGATRSTALAPQQADVLARLRVQRELHAAALARRGRARQGLAAGQDAGRRVAAVREPALLYGHMWGHPGKKLLFMGGEFGQRREWNHDSELDWWLLGDNDRHRRLQRWVADLNRLYRTEPALHALDFDAAGFEWVDGADSECSVLTYLRNSGGGEVLLVAANFTPVPRENYLVGVPKAGRWREVLNSDATLYGGSGVGNLGGVDSVPVAAHGRFQSLNLTLPPLGVVFLKHEGEPA
jgi:1,4-alpha-glucan branching enzyme